MSAARDQPNEAEGSATLSRALLGRVGAFALVSALVFTPIIARVLVDGRAELAAAAEAEASGDLDAQIRHLGRAARWRLPLASHDERARAQLRELAEDAELAGDLDASLVAWRELRRALIGTRAIDVADADALAEANAAIVSLMVREADAAGRPSDAPRWAAELEEELEPRGRSLLAAACFVAWLVASVGLFVRGIDDKGRLEPRAALRWGGAALLSLLAWMFLF